ncbi:hypothetical protein Pla123a_00180 [Posidoniimonas polymericola]|uniref:Uncharacterized protein n=1 Tax=Posidoniimonas polymericola TaxID=2528002 RepID=A0A5C5ZD16_9BACT|nr:hypothetical protein [Posidoniimonas polymericola]TWT85212.1 hypothetical protein Pla123a_00180 [Posidoniimonas polymericola]
MKYDLDQLCSVLSASCEKESPGTGHVQVRFADPLLKYEMAIDEQHNSISLAADPEKPIQACPLLEYYFACNEIAIGESGYGDGPAVRFMEHRESLFGTRLTMIKRHDGRWYLFANALLRHPMEGG